VQALDVSIESLAPSSIPSSGRVTVSGRVTNVSETAWTDLNVYLVTSAEPMLSPGALAEAADSDPAEAVGQRLTALGLYESIGDLAPGSSREYRLSVPREDLGVSGAAGVYWLSVHVLGATEAGRDMVADGRARTFIPLMAPDGPGTRLALLVPVKATVRRKPDTTLTDVDGWRAALSPDGRLGRLEGWLETSGRATLSLVVDPAVLDAAASLAVGNLPVLDVPTAAGAATEAPSGDRESPSEGAADGPDGGGGEDAGAEGEEQAEGAAEARLWLEGFQRAAVGHAVLAAPYADSDLAAMSRRHRTALYDRAADVSTATFQSLGMASTPAVAPPSGLLPTRAVRAVGRNTLVVLSDAAAPGAGGPVISTRARRVVLVDDAAGGGGPGPTDPDAALAVRQRVLSEAALHALSAASDEPLIVSLPQRWDPGSDWRQADFFAGLDVAWLRTVDVPSAVRAVEAAAGPAAYDDRLAYPAEERRSELGRRNLGAAQRVIDQGEVLSDLLTRSNTIDEDLAEVGLLAASANARIRPDRFARRAAGTVASVRRLLDRVSIDGPSFVTMSSEEGPIQVTVVNGLGEGVAVAIDADTGGDDLEISSTDLFTLPAGQRSTVRLTATATDIGVHPVTLELTTATGLPVGRAEEFNVRSSQVGLVVWAIMGLGAGVVLVASGVRVTRRIRARKATHGPVLKSGPP
jgi:hypothetical protein